MMTRNAHVKLALRAYVEGCPEHFDEFTQPNFYSTMVHHIGLPGLQLGVLHMLKGEHAYILVEADLAFGGDGLLPKVPPDSAIVFDITLVEWSKHDLNHELPFRPRSLGYHEDVKLVLDRQAEAEDAYAKGNKALSLRLYRMAERILRGVSIDGTKHKDQVEERDKMLSHILLRASQCAFELGSYPHALTLGRECINLDKKNVNANFLLGTSYFALGHIRQARNYILEALMMDPMNKQYAAKMKEIEDHAALVFDDEFDDEEDGSNVLYEEYAKAVFKRLKENDKVIRERITKLLSKHLYDNNEREIELHGGFSREFLEKIAPKLESCDPDLQVNVYPADNSLKIIKYI